MSMSVIAHGAEHRWQHLNGKVTLAGTGARVVGTGRGRWGGAGLRALLPWAHRIQHIPAALEGPSSRHHLRDSHVTPAPNHQDSCSSCEAIEILTPGGTSQPSSVTETATFKRGSWGTWVSKEGFCEEATPSPSLGISLVDQRHQLCLHTLLVLPLSPVLTVAEDGGKLPMADGQARLQTQPDPHPGRFQSQLSLREDTVRSGGGCGGFWPCSQQAAACAEDTEDCGRKPQRRKGDRGGRPQGRHPPEGMALLLLSLELSLVSAQDFNLQRIVRRNHDISKVLGTWYSISMAADDMRRIEEDRDLRVFMQSIESLENGGLKFSFHFMLHTEGVDVAMVCDKTDKNGEYAITCPWGGGRASPGLGEASLGGPSGAAGVSTRPSTHKGPCPWPPGDAGTGRGLGKAEQSFHADLGENRLQVLEAYYLWYMTFRLQNFRNRTETQVLALYGRFPELKPSFLDRFEKICKSHGLGPENIVNLSNNDAHPKVPIAKAVGARAKHPGPSLGTPAAVLQAGASRGRGVDVLSLLDLHKALGVEVERPENRGQWSQCARADLLLPRPSLGRLPAGPAARKGAEEKGLAANPTGKHARSQERQVQEQGAPGRGTRPQPRRARQGSSQVPSSDSGGRRGELVRGVGGDWARSAHPKVPILNQPVSPPGLAPSLHEAGRPSTEEGQLHLHPGTLALCAHLVSAFKALLKLRFFNHSQETCLESHPHPTPDPPRSELGGTERPGPLRAFGAPAATKLGAAAGPGQRGHDVVHAEDGPKGPADLLNSWPGGFLTTAPPGKPPETFPSLQMREEKRVEASATHTLKSSGPSLPYPHPTPQHILDSLFKTESDPLRPPHCCPLVQAATSSHLDYHSSLVLGHAAPALPDDHLCHPDPSDTRVQALLPGTQSLPSDHPHHSHRVTDKSAENIKTTLQRCGTAISKEGLYLGHSRLHKATASVGDEGGRWETPHEHLQRVLQPRNGPAVSRQAVSSLPLQRRGTKARRAKDTALGGGGGQCLHSRCSALCPTAPGVPVRHEGVKLSQAPAGESRWGTSWLLLAAPSFPLCLALPRWPTPGEAPGSTAQAVSRSHPCPPSQGGRSAPR
ncbi:hypothetical protein J1605_017251 [Eschrichtius robustus]|uniref:Lipocalin/cytosolic fatty-acid binding domain-containing protein n=1 Tax=Eschrichtius robustus TaxID=9764 RepID=A0AB34I1T0_ESCRO|nr:hypothetical protein J1605_017251 [Eschrichtius robustus]